MSRRPAISVAFSVIFASSLVAQQRTFVSAQHGSDSNPCSVGSPCRTFAAAISAVAAGGEVVVLDSGGYGQFTVSKAVSVETPAGIYAGVSATAGDGIDVSAGASDIVVLRGLTVYGFSGAGKGIRFLSGAGLYVESCVVNGFPSNGIGQIADGNLFLTDTVVRNGGDVGVNINPSTGSHLFVDHCRIENNESYGLFILDGVTASVRDSAITGNLAAGIAEGATGTTPAELNIEDCLVANNAGHGITQVNAGPGTIRVSGSTVTDNPLGGLRNQAGHTFESFGNNHVRGNGTDIQGTITVVPNN
jgi:hypothetical protein